jgi:PAS domain S-box-containing protein
MRPGLKRSIVIPLGVGLAILLGVFTTLFYIGQTRNLDETRERDRLSVERYFEKRVQAAVVQPGYTGNRLAGYRVLRAEIGQFTTDLNKLFGLEVVVALRKDRLERAAWETAMRQQDGAHTWGRFDHAVLVGQTLPISETLANYLSQARGERDDQLRINANGRLFLGGNLALHDAAGAEFGEILFLRDRTALARDTQQTFLLSALVALAVGLLCAVLLYERVLHFFLTPLLELRSVAVRAGRGELSQVAVVHRPDELGDLARSINCMIVDLRAAQAEQTRFVLDAALDAVVLFEPNGQIIDWNRAAEALFGWPRADAIGKSVFDLLRSDSSRALECALEDYRTAGNSGLFNRLLEERLLARNGRALPVEMAIAPVRTASGVFISVFVRDTSDRKRLEEDLRASQRLEAVGKLAGGIAHDFNNLITAIVGYASSVQESLEPGTGPHDDTLEIRRAADRATTLVQQLLAFARKRIVQPRVIDCNDLVGRIDRMLRRLIGENIHLETHLDRRLWPVVADPGQLEQVLVNLALNARDAMPKGGRLTILTSNMVISSAISRRSALPPGNYAMISVADTGLGMDDQTLAHIFEPFFTTKQAGQGTGLGLATCYGIIKQAGGHIRVTSAPQRGTIFRIYLPQAEQPVEPVVERPELVTSGSPAQETILLVEDEHQVRRLVERTLKQQGYTLLTASNGAEAVRVSRDYAEQIQLLLTDVVMPEMGGREAAAAILHQRPDVKVIYMSGYSEELVRLQGGLTDSAAFIAKPFAPDELRRVIRDVLDAVVV